MIKKFFFILLLVSLNSLEANSQNLTINQLIDLTKKEVGQAEEYLSSRGWEMYKAKSPKEDFLGYIIFSYQKSTLNDKAISFLTFYFNEYNDDKRVKIQVNSSSKYNEYLSVVKSLGCKLISSHVTDGDLVKVYQGATKTFIITTSTMKDVLETKTTWEFFIMNNSIYDLMFN